jgi:hypothetical protein
VQRLRFVVEAFDVLRTQALHKVKGEENIIYLFYKEIGK